MCIPAYNLHFIAIEKNVLPLLSEGELGSLMVVFIVMLWMVQLWNCGDTKPLDWADTTHRIPSVRLSELCCGPKLFLSGISALKRKTQVKTNDTLSRILFAKKIPLHLSTKIAILSNVLTPLTETDLLRGQIRDTDSNPWLQQAHWLSWAAIFLLSGISLQIIGKQWVSIQMTKHTHTQTETTENGYRKLWVTVMHATKWDVFLFSNLLSYIALTFN